MNFQPPPVKDQRTLSMQINEYNSRLVKTDCSPLLRTSTPSDGPSQNRNHFHNNRPYKNVHNRLGKRNQYNKNNNANIDTNNQNGPFTNRKRLSDGSNQEPSMPKRKWNNKRQPFYQNSNNSYQRNTAQNRMNQLRGSIDNIAVHNDFNQEESSNNLNDTQELDATDITVQVVNNLMGQAPPEETERPERFKMILDAKRQAAIKVIQQKRKEKQVVISPFPVPPHVTGISLHERFTNL